jgi:hypothetical protein
MPKTPLKAKISMRSGDQREVNAHRVGKYFAVTDSSDYQRPIITHLGTGWSFCTPLGIERAKRMVGVLDVLLPFNTSDEILSAYNALPKNVQVWIRRTY